jgi:septal ring factor EnvC (AmiA/AmiB activator)
MKRHMILEASFFILVVFVVALSGICAPSAGATGQTQAQIMSKDNSVMVAQASNSQYMAKKKACDNAMERLRHELRACGKDTRCQAGVQQDIRRQNARCAPGTR